MSKKPTEETKNLLKQVIEHFDEEDRGVRDRQIRVWRRLKLLWENVQHTYYSEVNHDWRVPEDQRSGEESDQAAYDKPVNIFRAYLESIIAALSVSVPSITCYPDDADNPLDISTAKAGDKIAELLFRHNDAPLLWLHALFVFCTEGMTACYTYSESKEEYGTYKDKEYADEMKYYQQPICPDCGAELGEKEQVTEDNFTPPEEQQQIDQLVTQGIPTGLEEKCPNCNQIIVPKQQQSSEIVTKLVGVTDKPKSRVCMQVYGGLFVKVPVWARNQKDCPYLIFSYETHYANVLSEYPDLRDKIVRQGATGVSGSYELYEQWGRISPQFHGEYPINNVTVRKCWLRPCAFNVLNKDDAATLTKEYPDGCKAIMVNDCVADAEEEGLDEHWTLTHNPLSDYIHHDPLGLLLVSVQDITNDLLSLVLQTVEHGIPQTFADPKVLNFNAYRNSEVIPGGIYPATPKSGKSLSDGFYEVRTAVLSQEVLPFAEKVQQIGQMVSGALPSLFGGQMSGSRTASEYSMSRSQALQRLQTTWKMLTMWWKNVFGKAIPLYISEMQDDEHQVKKDEFGNFVNVFIRRAELEGKIGSVELEANENLPITWNQQKDTIMELLQSNNEQLIATLASPENMPYIKRAVGLTDYIVPGEDDRQKQYEEIQQLTNSEPIPQPPDPMMVQQAMQMGMPPPPPIEVASVPIEPELDDNALEAEICRRWLVSDAGRLCKLENEPGYKNVLLHMKMHKDADMQMQMQQAAMMAPPPKQPQQSQQAPKQQAPQGPPPINGDNSVRTIQ